MPPVALRQLSELSVPKSALPEFTPPPRFQQTGFDSYTPQHPSQAEAVQAVCSFIAPQAETGFRWPWQKRAAAQLGLYLDGGFGVGKTHLLAAAYNAFVGSKAYLSFAELVHVIGVYGKVNAQRAFGERQLYCIDEFELDDPGNTLIVKTFLAHVFAQGGRVITTSNTPPKAQGEGRFNTRDFQREIQSIAAQFASVAIDGPDFRQRNRLATLLTAQELARHQAYSRAAEPKVTASWQDLFELLQALHPIRYGELLRQVGTLYLTDPDVIPNQNDALRLVHFIDKLYDLKIGLCLSGTLPLDQLFDSSYRHSAYAKKHYRCLSRIAELLDEARAQLP